MPMTMCPFCNVEHESVDAMGTTVIGCPKIGATDPPIFLNLPKRLPPEIEANYERAAVALENHERSIYVPDDARAILREAYRKAARTANHAESVENIDDRAARLLRECILKGEPLP